MHLASHLLTLKLLLSTTHRLLLHFRHFMTVMTHLPHQLTIVIINLNRYYPLHFLLLHLNFTRILRRRLSQHAKFV